MSGNSPAAQKIREQLQKGKKCLSFATKSADADAILEISQSDTGDSGGLGVKDSTVSGTLTSKSGEWLWSGSERFSDAPFMSGGKTAAKIVLGQLAKKIGCN